MSVVVDQPSVLATLSKHPQWGDVLKVYHSLVGAGHRTLIAGGAVRDALLGIAAHDIDIATSARPEQVEALFAKTVSVGKSFGVIRVLEGQSDLEVATFRQDQEYVDGRRPQGVVFSDDKEDALRRDFTVNALFFDINSQQVIDHVGGLADLKAGLVRAVGAAQQRFEEDQLRIMRAIRFAGQLNFAIEEKTLQALSQMMPKIHSVSRERITDELVKLLKSKARARAFDYANETGLFRELFVFRVSENWWPQAVAVTEDWQFLALFLAPATQSLEDSVSHLRLSRDQQKNIAAFMDLWRNEKAFFEQRLGLQLSRVFESGVYFGLQVLIQEKGFAPQYKILQDFYVLNQGVKPSPWFKGGDFVAQLQGVALGDKLKELYCLQLEGRWSSEAEARKDLGLER